MIDEYSPALDARLQQSSLQAAHEFFGSETLPRYREDALSSIGSCWNMLTPRIRSKIFSNCFTPTDCEMDWHTLIKNFTPGEAERLVITHLFGDDKNPLYE